MAELNRRFTYNDSIVLEFITNTDKYPDDILVTTTDLQTHRVHYITISIKELKDALSVL